MTIGTRIMMARRAAGISQTELAQRAGVTANDLSQFECDEATPDSSVLVRLGHALDVRPDYFYRRSMVHSLAFPKGVRGHK